MGETASVSREKLIVSRFRELSEEGKQQLVDYMGFLYQKEESALETEKHKEENKYFFSEQERDSLERLVSEVQEFSKEEATMDAQKALRELCTGIFESEENLASNHDFFLYGAPKRK